MTAMSDDTVIEVEGLRMRYGTNDVLNGVDLRVRRGEVVTLLGPNGAGKTTTIEILEGFRIRSAGSVLVLGVDPPDASEDWRARVGIVLQSWRDHARWTPRALLEHLGRYYLPYSTPERTRPYDVDRLIAVVGLEEQARRKIRTLSGGERRRLDLAVGIIGRPSSCSSTNPRPGSTPRLGAPSTTWSTG
jgi:ABC-2 type transport system ATP-binding protein